MEKIEYRVSKSFGLALDYAVAYALNKDTVQSNQFATFKLGPKHVVDYFGHVFNPTADSEQAVRLFSDFVVSVFPLTDALWGSREYITEFKETCVESASMDSAEAYRTAGLRALATTTTGGTIQVTAEQWSVLKDYVESDSIA